MDNRFTAKAQGAIERAHREARELGHTYIGSEHLLLGLVCESGSVASKMLSAKGMDAELIRKKVVEVSGSGALSNVSAADMTPRTKRIIEQCAAEARKNSSKYIGTEHILYALLCEKDCVGARIIENCGLSVAELRADVSAYYGVGGDKSIGGAAKEKSGSKKISGAPTLSNYGRDLTALAREGRIDPVIGREEESSRVIRILSRRTKNNPCLVGEPGVGKTAVVEGLATLIAEGNVPDTLIDSRIISLDVTSMIAGAKYRGEFEERMRAVIEEVTANRDIILFVDELHVMVGAGAAEGAVDAANILKPALARGEIRMIGATTLGEYRTHIEKDAALERRFQAVNVSEPDEKVALDILRGLRDRYEAHHALSITDGALEAAVRLSVRYIPDRFLPDKAIDLIDEAAAKLRIDKYTLPPELKEAERRLSELERETENAIISQDFELAAALRDEEIEIRMKRDEIEDGFLCADGKEGSGLCVSEKEIAEVVTAWTGIPTGKLAVSESERLLNLEAELSECVVGQGEAIRALSLAIRRGRLGLKDEKRPIGSFIFLGRTGVGKTELAKALALSLFSSEGAMLRFDMSEYMEKHSVSKLIGSPPGYVGYGEGGLLTERVRRRPYSVLLFDEIEKAHPDVYDLLLQILDDGSLCDSQGRRVDFRNTVIIMTSNAGAAIAERSRTLGFSEGGVREGEQKLRENMLSALRSAFKPEFLGRVDEVIVFNSLGVKELEKIAKKMLCELESRALSIGIEVEFSPGIAEYIAKKSYSPSHGARSLRRSITKELEDDICERFLLGKLPKGKRTTVTLKNGELFFE